MAEFEQKVERLWSNPNTVDTQAPLLYEVDIICGEGTHYRYIDHSDGESALTDLQQDLRNIEQGLDRGDAQNYGAVHLALYRSLKREWQYKCTVLENVEPDDLQSRLNALLRSDSPNLNQAASWRLADMEQLTIDGLIAEGQ